MSYSKFSHEINEYLVNRKKDNLPAGDYYAIVRDKWISDKRYKELIAFILENWDSGNCDDFSRPFSKHLIDNNEFILFKQLWKGIIRNRLEKLWISYDNLKKHFPHYTIKDIKRVWLIGYNQFSSKESIQRDTAYKRKYTLKGISEFIKGLEKLGEKDEIIKQKVLYEIVNKLEKPLPKPSTDTRKIDEILFWQLIEDARAKSIDQFQFIDNLKSILESFYPKEMRNFNKILLTKINELNKYELWALAYIVRHGCGDDEFDYYRAWVVSKGRSAFEAINNFNEKELVSIFNEDPQLEELYYLAEQVYEDKTSDLMQPVIVKTSKILGKEWKEDKLNETFPTLCKLFNYEKNGL